MVTIVQIIKFLFSCSNFTGCFQVTNEWEIDSRDTCYSTISWLKTSGRDEFLWYVSARHGVAERSERNVNRATRGDQNSILIAPLNLMKHPAAWLFQVWTAGFGRRRRRRREGRAGLETRISSETSRVQMNARLLARCRLNMRGSSCVWLERFPLFPREATALCTFRSAAAFVLLRGPANNQTRESSFRELARGPIDYPRVLDPRSPILLFLINFGTRSDSRASCNCTLLL